MFFTTSLSLLTFTGTSTNLSTLIYLLYFSNFLNEVVLFFNLSISNLSTSDFKLAKSACLPNFDVSTPAAFFKSTFVS